MGEVFREWYGKVLQLCSLAHTNTPVLALIATSTLNVQTKIMQNVGMGSYTIIQGSLDRPNIRYSAVKVSQDLQLLDACYNRNKEDKSPMYYHILSFFEDLCFFIQAVLVASLPRTIIFCHSMKTCASLFNLFLSHLREKSYEPVLLLIDFLPYTMPELMIQIRVKFYPHLKTPKESVDYCFVQLHLEWV